MENKENQGIVKKSFVKGNMLGFIVKVLLGAGSLVGIADGSVDELYIIGDVASTGQQVYVQNEHDNGATEAYDVGKDSQFLEGPLASHVNFYSNNPSSTPNRLSADVRGLESMTTYSNEFEGVNLAAPTNIDLIFYTNGGFPEINIVQRLTDVADNTIEIYDAKTLASHYPNSPFSITVDNGITRKLKTEFYATADINIDGKVDLTDFAFISKNWAKSVSQADIYNPDSFSDINRDGTVDIIDLCQMAAQWLEETSQ